MSYESCNSDIVVDEKGYHVQTEIWDSGSMYIVSQVFSGGDLLEVFKARYGPRDRDFLSDMMANQHKRVVSFLESGFLD